MSIIRSLFVLTCLVLCLLTACQKHTNPRKKIDETLLDRVSTDVQADLENPHILMFGEEESIIIVRPELLEQHAESIRGAVAGEATEEDIEITIDGSLIDNTLSERLYYGVLDSVESVLSDKNDPLNVDFTLESTNFDESNPPNLKGPSLPTRQGAIKKSSIKPSADDVNFKTKPNNNSLRPKDIALPALSKMRNSENISAEGNLISRDSTPLDVKGKKTARYLMWRKIQSLQQVIQKFKKSDKSYFMGAIRKKNVDTTYSKFNEMHEISLSNNTKSLLLGKKNMTSSVINRVEAKVKPYGNKVTLGMLPKKGLLEDIGANTQARENIRGLLKQNGKSNTQIKDFIAEFDTLKHQLLTETPGTIKTIRDGTDGQSDLSAQYNKLKNEIGDTEAFENALGSRRLEAEKRLDNLIESEYLPLGLTQKAILDKKLTELEKVDKLRQTFRYLDDNQIQLFQSGSVNAIQSSLNPLQRQIIDSNGGIQNLHSDYKTLRNYDKGNDTLADLIIPRKIDGYQVDTDKVSVASIVEGFELDAVIPGAENLKQKSIITDLGEGRFRVKIQDSLLKEGLGIENVDLTQFSTRDRTVMTPKLLSQAIDYSQSAILSGGKLFVHCKSGKGRSATVVVGTRTDAILTSLNENKVNLSKKEITQLVEDQIDQVKSARPLIGVSPPQKTLLIDTLFERQNTRNSR